MRVGIVAPARPLIAFAMNLLVVQGQILFGLCQRSFDSLSSKT